MKRSSKGHWLDDCGSPSGFVSFIKQLWVRSWVLGVEPFSFHTSFYISQIVYALLFQNRCQHFLKSWLATDLLSVFPSWIWHLPSLPRMPRQELFQHMKHFILTVWLSLELVQFSWPETPHGVTGVKLQCHVTLGVFPLNAPEDSETSPLPRLWVPGLPFPSLFYPQTPSFPPWGLESRS